MASRVSNTRSAHRSNGAPNPTAADKGGASREMHALQELKRELGVPETLSALNPSSGGGASPSLPERAMEAFLMRYLVAAQLSIPHAIAHLRQRRTFERRMPSLRVTAPVLSALRSGWVNLIGRDLRGRTVLCLTARHFACAPLDAGDAQRLMILVMEYVLAHASLVSAPDEVSGASNPPLQQFTLLVADEGSSWSASESLLAHLHTVSTVLAKYYPQLIALVLLLDASWDVRHGMKTAFADAPDALRGVVQMVSHADLHKYMDRAILPRALGGPNAHAESAAAFADAVLRHWYVMTSDLLAEDPSTRPLWQLPPVPPNARGRMAIPGGQRSPTPHLSRAGQPMGGAEAASLASSRRSFTFHAATMEEDDGVCSILSDTEERAYVQSSAKVSPREVQLDFAASPESLVGDLQRERELRHVAETQLRKLRLGITLDLATATEVERSLAGMHAEVNTLIANVIVRANQAAAAKSPPTLSQLLDLTLSALEAAAHRSERVPAMKFAVPAMPLEEKSSICCCVM